jgi:hypothetical protein
MPAGPYAHQYLYIDLERSYGRLLLERPTDNDLPEAQRLWDAMSEHYAGELQRPVSIRDRASSGRAFPAGGGKRDTDQDGNSTRSAD